LIYQGAGALYASTAAVVVADAASAGGDGGVEFTNSAPAIFVLELRRLTGGRATVRATEDYLASRANGHGALIAFGNGDLPQKNPAPRGSGEMS